LLDANASREVGKSLALLEERDDALVSFSLHPPAYKGKERQGRCACSRLFIFSTKGSGCENDDNDKRTGKQRVHKEQQEKKKQRSRKRKGKRKRNNERKKQTRKEKSTRKIY
jgi:hypothetical protein